MDDVRFPPHPTLAGDAIDEGCAGLAGTAPAETYGIEIPIDMTERFRTLGNVVAFLRGPVLRAAG
jgi:hypothetical protein